MKTAEEILSKRTGLTINDEDAYIIHTKTEYVLKAMEEYASQYKTRIDEFAEWMSDKDFIDGVWHYSNESGDIIRATTQELYMLFLTKTKKK